jgi:hypothetical protein
MDCKSMTTPMTINLKLLSDKSSYLVDPTMYIQLIGCLMYLVNTRPNICFTMNTLSQHMVEPRHVHWMAAKHMLRYLRGTVAYGLRYVSSGNVKRRDIQILTGQGVQWIGRVLSDVVLVWDQAWSNG